MESREDKKYFAHKSKIWWFKASLFGSPFLITQLITKSSNLKLEILFFLLFVAFDVVVTTVQFIKGRFARVSFNEDGFEYKKYFKSEFVSWNDIYIENEVTLFFRDIRYYHIKNKTYVEKEYYIEKNKNTMSLIDKFYFKDALDEKQLTLPNYRKQAINFWVNVIGIGLIVAIFLFVMQRANMISSSLAMIISIATLLLMVLSIIIFSILKRDIRYKINKDGVRFKIEDEEHFIKWEDTKKVYSRVEHLGREKTKILMLWPDKEIDWKYTMIELPASDLLIEKAYKLAKVKEG